MLHCVSCCNISPSNSQAVKAASVLPPQRTAEHERRWPLPCAGCQPACYTVGNELRTTANWQCYPVSSLQSQVTPHPAKFNVSQSMRGEGQCTTMDSPKWSHQAGACQTVVALSCSGPCGASISLPMPDQRAHHKQLNHVHSCWALRVPLLTCGHHPWACMPTQVGSGLNTQRKLVRSVYVC